MHLVKCPPHNELDVGKFTHLGKWASPVLGCCFHQKPNKNHRHLRELPNVKEVPRQRTEDRRGNQENCKRKKIRSSETLEVGLEPLRISECNEK